MISFHRIETGEYKLAISDGTGIYAGPGKTYTGTSKEALLNQYIADVHTVSIPKSHKKRRVEDMDRFLSRFCDFS